MIEPEGSKGITSHVPANGSEMVTVMVHYYRGELARMAGWRDRLTGRAIGR